MLMQRPSCSADCMSKRLATGASTISKSRSVRKKHGAHEEEPRAFVAEVRRLGDEGLAVGQGRGHGGNDPDRVSTPDREDVGRRVHAAGIVAMGRAVPHPKKNAAEAALFPELFQLRGAGFRSPADPSGPA